MTLRPHRLPARLTGLLSALLLTALMSGALVALGGAAAVAATMRVRLTAAGPSPATVGVVTGDAVAFTNTDLVLHRVSSTSAGFVFDQVVLPGATVTTGVLRSAGTFSYVDNLRFPGKIVVSPAPVAPPPATTAPPATASPAPARTTSPAPVSGGGGAPPPAGGGGSGSAPGATTGSGGTAPGTGSNGGTGTAGSPQLPGFLGGSLPGGTPASGLGPAPAVAPYTQPTASDGSFLPGSGTALGPDGRPVRGTLAQRSAARRLGLPTALAVITNAGALTLLLRVLAARRARTA